MIICPNCNYQNPDGASQCEACYTPLPALITCSNCGATAQADASFCGQCGHSLANQPAAAPVSNSSLPEPQVLEPEPVTAAVPPVPVSAESSSAPAEPSAALAEPSSEPIELDPLVSLDPLLVVPPPPLPDDPIPANIPTAVDIYTEPPITQPAANAIAPQTQIQSLTAKLLHVQTDTPVELPIGLDVVHIGKPNDRIPPDIDVSGFPESEIVSRVHANIRIEGDVYYIEDVGSSNGTYINNLPLAAGNRHRLRPGDRIALGKGDKVSFIFQLA
ncbi:fha domain-containing protein [Leptolyngbya sp. Heron Island J]|uniref:FHA domain-containing protein n=1 Tax=Leptolyngbya sp. Heron Island J TaxID=1385935 RepID=UPI0003B9DD1A|nr:FHA domain-containing protein [Leptolyngbya sp. Heron Island J]ESA36780.1 fha domain-containing protein [Leptolyngbya sp. Heron Island J]